MPQVLAVSGFEYQGRSYAKGTVITIASATDVAWLEGRKLVEDDSTIVAAAIAASAPQVVHIAAVSASSESTLVIYSWSEFQAKHDALVAVGGGELHFVPNATYSVPAGATVIIDWSYVGVQLNGAKIDLSAWYGVDEASSTKGVVFDVTATRLRHAWPPNTTDLKTIENGTIYGVIDAPTRGDWGPTAFRFNKSYSDDSGTHSGDSAAPNGIVRRVVVSGVRRHVELGSRAYFVRFQNCNFLRAWDSAYPIDPVVTSLGSLPLRDYAEKDVFEQCIIAENKRCLNTVQAGQILTYNNCSLDYNQQLFNLALGAKVFLNSCHLEFDYGKNAGETTAPIAITGATTGVWGRNLVIAYNNSTQNPYWPSFATMDNGSQVLDLEISKCDRMGRLVDGTSFDSWVIVTGSVSPMVRIKADVVTVSPDDVPAMTQVAETLGLIGLLRNGCDPYTALNAVIAKTGTANNPASDNTDAVVTRKNSKAMLVLQNGTPGTAAKYYINLPVRNFAARHAWQFFFNTQNCTGTAPLIKEMLATAAAKFDGTTVTWGQGPETPYYSNASGISLTLASNWTRHSWKTHAPNYYPNPRQNMSQFITLEIDMTNTTGKLFISHFGFDVISASN